MLSKLIIKDIVLIKDLNLNFHEGFTVLTGETGTGKSILIDSLGLILGNREITNKKNNIIEEPGYFKNIINKMISIF